jgi:exocyst complex component 1
LLAGHDGRELKRGIDLLRKRVEKHFGEADEPGISRGLVTKVWRACEQRYAEIVKQVDELGSDVYDGELGTWIEEREVEKWFRGSR